MSLYVESRKRYRRTHLQHRDRPSDTENKLTATKGESGADRVGGGWGLWDWRIHTAAAAAKSHQSCPTLCDPTDGSPPGSPIPGFLQASTPEWVAIPFSSERKWKVKVKLLSRVWLFTTPWTVAHPAPLSTGFPTQEYWSGLPLPSPIYMLLYIKYINNKALLYSTGNYIEYFVIIYKEKESEKE